MRHGRNHRRRTDHRMHRCNRLPVWLFPLAGGWVREPVLVVHRACGHSTQHPPSLRQLSHDPPWLGLQRARPDRGSGHRRRKCHRARGDDMATRSDHRHRYQRQPISPVGPPLTQEQRQDRHADPAHWLAAIATLSRTASRRAEEHPILHRHRLPEPDPRQDAILDRARADHLFDDSRAPTARHLARARH